MFAWKIIKNGGMMARMKEIKLVLDEVGTDPILLGNRVVDQQLELARLRVLVKQLRTQIAEHLRNGVIPRSEA